MGVYVTVMNEIVNRLTTAQGSGKKLDSTTAMGLKQFVIGERSAVDGINAMPAILLTMSNTNILETYEGTIRPNKIKSDVSVTLLIKYGLTDEHATNRYFKTSDSTGILYFIEKVLDVLNETTGQVIDPRFGQDAVKPSKAIIGAFQPHSNYIICELQINFQTAMFAINNRSA